MPHQWLQVIAPQKLRRFLLQGPLLNLVTDETLAARGDDMAEPTIANVLSEGDDAGQKRHARSGDEWKGHGPPPDPNAASGFPQEWSVRQAVRWKSSPQLISDYRSSPRHLLACSQVKSKGKGKEAKGGQKEPCF